MKFAFALLAICIVVFSACERHGTEVLQALEPHHGEHGEALEHHEDAAPSAQPQASNQRVRRYFPR